MSTNAFNQATSNDKPKTSAQSPNYSSLVGTIMRSGNAAAWNALLDVASQNEKRLIKIAVGSQTIDNLNMIDRLVLQCNQIIDQFQIGTPQPTVDASYN